MYVGSRALPSITNAALNLVQVRRCAPCHFGVHVLAGSDILHLTWLFTFPFLVHCTMSARLFFELVHVRSADLNILKEGLRFLLHL